MKNRKGFTLLEVLVVVVIAISVTAFAVPAYKKTQEKNKYLAAQGVLLDLGAAVQALRADFIAAGMDENEAPDETVSLIDSYNSTGTRFEELGQLSSISDLFTVTFQSEGATLSNDSRVAYALVAQGYLQPIPYDYQNRYKGYLFYLCPADGKGADHCCKADSTKNRIACMRAAELCSKADYPGAYIDERGLVVPFDKGSEAAKTACK